MTGRTILVAISLSWGCVGSMDESFETDDKEVTEGGPTGPARVGGERMATPPAAPVSCGARDVGPAPLRRLTRWEYDNTIRDLLGDTSHPSAAFPPDVKTLGFSNNAEAQDVSPLHAQNFLDAAERLAAKAASNLDALVPCKTRDAACAARFIEVWGRRAWRRPLDSAERAALQRVFAAGLAGGGVPTGIQMVVEVILQSPQFLYRLELGSDPGPAPGLVRLSPWELATRLSYFLWGSTPDEALLLAAEQGKLATPDEVAGQARRMLADRRARDVVASFHEQWLELEKLDGLDKDRRLFPAWTPALVPLFQRETRAFLDAVVWQEQGRLGMLLTAPFTFVDARLAAFYGLAGRTGETFERVALDPGQRVGLLAQGGFLSAHAQFNQTDVVNRGKFVREALFCQFPPPPPPALEIRAPELDPNLTTRERFARHSEDPACSGCHALMDPIGLGFETFDAIGRFRTTENGKPVDASGRLVATDVDGPFVGVPELARRLASSREVQACVAKQWFRFAHGRAETPRDRCSTEPLEPLLAASDLPGFLVALVKTDAFLYRSLPGGAP